MSANWQRYAPPGTSPSDVVKFSRSQGPFDAQTWKDLERYRRLFPRKLIVKGIMSPQDAIRCAEAGCDGVIVSNHGARQLDQAPASLEVLPAVKAAVGDRLTVMLDTACAVGPTSSLRFALAPSSCSLAGQRSTVLSREGYPG